MVAGLPRQIGCGQFRRRRKALNGSKPGSTPAANEPRRALSAASGHRDLDIGDRSIGTKSR